MRSALKKVGAMLLATMAISAFAQGSAEKNIELVVPFTPGGSADGVMRLVAAKMAEDLKRTVIVLNKPGAGGVVGTTEYSKAPPDGNTLIHGYVATISINPALYGEKLPYKPERDLVPVAPVMKLPMFLVVNQSVPARNLAEYVALAKAKPGTMMFASAGNGGSNHLAGELLKTMAGVQMQHVPYNGSAPALNAVVGGHVPSMFDSGLALAHVKTGKLYALAVSTAQRLPEHPDIPTVAESYPGFEAVSWHGLFAPAGTPKPIVERLNAAITRAVQSAEVKQWLAKNSLQPYTATPDEFASFIRAETQKWGEVVRSSGARID